MKRTLFFLFIFSCGINCLAQNIPINQWRSHLPYTDGVCVVEAGTKLYCATLTGLFYFDKSDNSIHTLSKVDGFSDVFIKTMAYDAQHDNLFIAYQSGNLDILHGGKIKNEPLFMNHNVSINSITIFGDSAYFATSGDINSSGINIYSIGADNFPETISSLGPINRVAILRDTLYACSTDSGVKRIPGSYPNLNDPNQWQKINDSSCTNIATFNGRIFGAFGTYLRSYNGSTWTTIIHEKYPIMSLESNNGYLVCATNAGIYILNSAFTLDSFLSAQQNDVIIDKQGTVWIAKNTFALLNSNQSGGNQNYFEPGGKPTVNANTAYGYHNEIWVSGGFYKNNNAPGFDNSGFSMYDGETWHNYTQSSNPPMPNLRDYMGMAKDTVTNHLWIGCLEAGILEFDPISKSAVNVYTNTNSNNVLPPNTPASGVGFDKDDNLWACFYRPSNGHQLAMRNKNGSWVSIIGEPTNAGPQPQVNALLVDDDGFVWLIDSRDGNGVWIYNNTLKSYAELTSTQGAGNLPSANVLCIAKDKTSQVWMGTSAGPCVYSDPTLLFGTQKYDVQRPYVNNGVNSGYLLAAQAVNCIAVDGANRKWFGTNDGAWLTSADGTTIISHFNASNSPLVSNIVNSIGINGVTGEVFFVTDKGIISYRGTATDGGTQNQDVYAFPNPVKPGYNGPIAIRGLVADANVKITDITGALVFETTANGGEAIWDGKNFSGRAANSGVYLAFITNGDGSETKIVKILIVR